MTLSVWFNVVKILSVCSDSIYRVLPGQINRATTNTRIKHVDVRQLYVRPMAYSTVYGMAVFFFLRMENSIMGRIAILVVAASLATGMSQAGEAKMP